MHSGNGLYHQVTLTDINPLHNRKRYDGTEGDRGRVSFCYIKENFELRVMEKLSGERVFKLLKMRGFMLSMDEVQFITDFLKCFVELHGKLDEKNLLTKPVLNFDEAARYLRMSPSHLYKLTSSKQVPHYCPQGKKIYFNREELDSWLLRNRRLTKDEIEVAATNYIIRNKR